MRTVAASRGRARGCRRRRARGGEPRAETRDGRAVEWARWRARREEFPAPQGRGELDWKGWCLGGGGAVDGPAAAKEEEASCVVFTGYTSTIFTGRG
uniref:Uncharacterized protein n=1 Tax=Oryza brachyantha TaxID=4533 RepID=J3LI35_ORYBR